MRPPSPGEESVGGRDACCVRAARSATCVVVAPAGIVACDGGAASDGSAMASDAIPTLLRRMRRWQVWPCTRTHELVEAEARCRTERGRGGRGLQYVQRPLREEELARLGDAARRDLERRHAQLHGLHLQGADRPPGRGERAAKTYDALGPSCCELQRRVAWPACAQGAHLLSSRRVALGLPSRPRVSCIWLLDFASQVLEPTL